MSGFQLRTKSVTHLRGKVCFLSNSVNFCCSAGLIVKHSIYMDSLKNSVEEVLDLPAKANRCICVQHGATYCSSFYSNMFTISFKHFVLLKVHCVGFGGI